jgi:uncharacterized protein (DUF362 family)
MNDDGAVVSVFPCAGDLGVEQCVAAALASAGFWEALGRAAEGHDPATFRIFIKPDLAGFQSDSPLATNPTLVEDLVDLLDDRGFSSVTVGTAPDGAAAWAANRDVFALFDLMGYKFATSKGRNYAVQDLSESLVEGVFPVTSSLRDAKLSESWLHADFRIVFAKCKTDEADGYALCLNSLIDVLPEHDKDFHYRRARSPGEVISDVLALTPVDFALIDALISSHGTAGRRAPIAIATQALIASSSIIVADYVCSLKMGLDPHQSRVMQSVIQTHPLPRYLLKGDTRPFENWQNAKPALVASRRYRAGAEYLDRLIEPWMQGLDPEIFSLKSPLDSTLNKALAPFFGGPKHSPTADILLIAVNVLIGAAGHMLESFRTLFDKDTIRQRIVSLGFDPESYDKGIFSQIIDDLDALEIIAIHGPERSGGLKWRMIDRAVVFSFERIIEIEFDLFTSKVDIAKVIQFMNDYLGGVLVPLEWDESGRPTRQAERNLYLPQPNYLVLFHGKPIDVSKLECAIYSDDSCSLYWKTIGSSNNSATYDDGKASFRRTKEGYTAISIIGKQLFELPLFWQVIDLDVVPDLKAPLVTDAYRTFFDRTMSNFEALVEGRDIRMGRSAETPSGSESEELSRLLDQVSRAAAPLISMLLNRKEGGPLSEADAEGFVHGSAPEYLTKADRESPVAGNFPQLIEFFAGLRQALARDLAMAAKRS